MPKSFYSPAEVEELEVIWVCKALVECDVHSAKEREFREMLLNLDEVIKIYSVTGDAEFIVHIGVGKMSELEDVIERMIEYTDTNTKMVLSMPHNDVLPKKLERLTSFG